MLAGARPDLEDGLAIAEYPLEDGEDRRAVALRGFRVRLQAARRTGMRRGPKGREKAPKRPAMLAPQCAHAPASVIR